MLAPNPSVYTQGEKLNMTTARHAKRDHAEVECHYAREALENLGNDLQALVSLGTTDHDRSMLSFYAIQTEALLKMLQHIEDGLMRVHLNSSLDTERDTNV
jgi:type I site-specific restriction endonuclease